MIISEWLELLKNTPRNWGFICDNMIRTEGKFIDAGGMCPLMATSGCGNGFNGARFHELHWRVGQKIMGVADGTRDDLELRDQLLEACGLKELT